MLHRSPYSVLHLAVHLREDQGDPVGQTPEGKGGLRAVAPYNTDDRPGCLSSQAHMVTPLCGVSPHGYSLPALWLGFLLPEGLVAFSLSAVRPTRSCLLWGPQSPTLRGSSGVQVPPHDQTQAGKTNQYAVMRTRGVLSQGVVQCQGSDGFYSKSQRCLT